MLEWITAIGTLFAALIPFALFLLERRDRQHAEAARDAAERARESVTNEFRVRELERLEAREESERSAWTRSQAEQVHFWNGIQDGALVFYAINNSTAPVSDIAIDAMVYFTLPGSPKDAEGKHLLLGIIHLPPTGQTPFAYGYGDLMHYSDFDAPPEGAKPTGVAGIRSVTFIDARGNKWRRDMVGWTAQTLSRINSK